MKLSAAFAFFVDLRAAIFTASVPTLRDVYRAPSLLLQPRQLSRNFFTHVWVVFGDPTDEGGREVKVDLITPNAKGVVLDLGAGLGHALKYLDRKKVTKYVALEPNTLMHSQLRQTANSAGYFESDGTLVVLGYGAEDVPSILSALGDHPHPIDTIVSVLTMCSIPSLDRTMAGLVRDTLRPGGEILFYEHVLSPRSDVAWWQRLWTPMWKIFFDGCEMDRPTHLLVKDLTEIDSTGKEASLWSEGKSWGKPGESAENLWWHQAGRFVKRVS